MTQRRSILVLRSKAIRCIFKFLRPIPITYATASPRELVKWGMSLGENDTLKVNLMASPMGFPVYVHLGFKDCGKVIVQMPDEVEKVTMHAMEYDPQTEEEEAAEL